MGLEEGGCEGRETEKASAVVVGERREVAMQVYTDDRDIADSTCLAMVRVPSGRDPVQQRDRRICPLTLILIKNVRDVHSRLQEYPGPTFRHSAARCAERRVLFPYTTARWHQLVA